MRMRKFTFLRKRPYESNRHRTAPPGTILSENDYRAGVKGVCLRDPDRPNPILDTLEGHLDTADNPEPGRRPAFGMLV